MTKYAVYQVWGNKRLYRGEYASASYAVKIARRHKEMNPGYRTYVKAIKYVLVPVSEGDEFHVYR